MTITQNSHPSREQLELFLKAETTPADTATIEAHIASCTACREALDESAADFSWWEEAEEFLPSDAEDRAYLTTIAGTQTDTPTDESDTSTSNNIRQILSWLAPTDDPAMLGRIGPYEIAGVIGSGGMGVVLKGFDGSLNRYVAVKVLAPHLADSGAARQRFAREAQAAAAVVHDNVVPIHAVDQATGLPYLVMPYLRGMSLQKRLNDHGPLRLEEVLAVAMQIARGLAAAHGQGLIHRDIKPANILLDGRTDRVFITDFGLARAADDASLTHSGVIAGTPHYMSPEQADGSNIDHRSDLFCLGSVMHAMCTGHPPFRAETSWGILKRVTEESPRPVNEINVDYPAWLARIIARLQNKSAADRFQSAAEVANLLEASLAHVRAPSKHELPVVVKNGSRSPSLRTALICGSVLAVLGLGLWWNQQPPTPDDSLATTSSGRQASVEPEDGSSTGQAKGSDVIPQAEEASTSPIPAWNEVTDSLAEIQARLEVLEREVGSSTSHQ